MREWLKMGMHTTAEEQAGPGRGTGVVGLHLSQ